MSPFDQLVALAGTFPKAKREPKPRDPVRYRNRMRLYMRKRAKQR